MIPHWKWSHISFADRINFKLWVPTIFNRYVKATMLSNWRWMTLCLMVFKNGCLASFMAQGSKTYMWFFISWADHILSVEIPLHVATQPFIEASVCINTSADGWINARPLRSFTFCTHHFKLIFEILFKIILSKKERFCDKDDICCIWRKLQFNLAGKTAWMVDVNKSINLANSRIDVCGLFNKFWHSETTFRVFVLFNENFRVTESQNRLFPVYGKSEMLQKEDYCITALAYLF